MQGTLTVVINTDKGTKQAGIVEFNIADYVNQGIKEKKEAFPLKKCPDANAKLYCRFQVLLLAEALELSSVNSAIAEEDSYEEDMSVNSRGISPSIRSIHTQENDDIGSATNISVSKVNELFGAKTTAGSRKLSQVDIKEEESPESTQATSNKKSFLEPEDDPNTNRSMDSVTRNKASSFSGRSPFGRAETLKNDPLAEIQRRVEKSRAEQATEKASFNKLFDSSKPIRPKGQSMFQPSENIVKRSTTLQEESKSEPNTRSANIQSSRTFGMASNNSSDDISPVRTSNVTPERSVADNSYTTTKSITETNTVPVDSQKLAMLQADLEDKETELAEIKRELANKSNENSKLKRLIESLREENDELRSGAGKNQASASTELIEIRRQLAEKNDELVEINKRNQDLETQLEELKQNLGRINRERAQDTRTHTQEMEKLKEKFKQLEADNAQLLKDNQKFTANFGKIENDFHKLQNDYNRVKKEKAEALERIQELETERENALSSTETHGQEIERLKERNQALVIENEDLKSQVKAIEADRANLHRAALEKFRAQEAQIKALIEEKNNLEAKYNELEKNHKEYSNKMEIALAEVKKQLKDAEMKKEEALSNQTKLTIELQNLKINYDRLNSDSTSKAENDAALQKQIESINEHHEKEIVRYKEKLNKLDEEYLAKEREYREEIDKIKAELREEKFKKEELEFHNQRLNEKLKQAELEKTAKEATSSSEFETQKRGYEAEIQKLTHQIEQKDKEVNELKNKMNEMSAQIDQLKAQLEYAAKEKASTKAEVFDNTRQIQELQEKFRSSEEKYRTQIEELKKENSRLQSDLESARQQPVPELNSRVEEELAQLSLENETLKKQVKDLTSQVNNSKISKANQFSKENEELKGRVKELQKSLQKVEDELAEIRIKYTESELQNERYAEETRKQSTKLAKTQDTLAVMESELVRTKQRLGETMNAIMEYGGSELLDKIYEAIAQYSKT